MWESVNNINAEVQSSVDNELSINVGELNDGPPTNVGESNVNSLSCSVDKIPFQRGMVMASLNINSLLAHIDELRIFINSTKVDILCINETKLDTSIKDHEVYLPGFEIIRRVRIVNGRNGGGVCIYIRCNIYIRKTLKI